jgi:hypothetical protein
MTLLKTCFGARETDVVFLAHPATDLKSFALTINSSFVIEVIPLKDIAKMSS